MADEPQANALTASKSDLSEWYSQVLLAADVIDQRFRTKGTFVWMPYGYRAMMNLKGFWDDLFQSADIGECHFPLIVPREYAEQNESWWEGFKEEGYRVIAGSEKKEQGIVRPTGEPAMYPMYSLWIRTEGDLPLRLYETVNSYRYETKHTRPLIRDREITVWHEIHTAHATKEEAEEEMRLHKDFYDAIWEQVALPSWPVWKPSWELFPGAVSAIEYYNTTPSGRVMENGSINFLGQAYSKKFDIVFTDGEGNKDHVWQVCTGNGARLLAAAFIVHGDDKGLVMPPRIAPLQAVIVPIYRDDNKEEVLASSDELLKELGLGRRSKVDSREISPGRRFYDWEIKGVPVRVELGPRDLENDQVVLVRRDTGEKETVKRSEAPHRVNELLEDIHDSLLKNATEMLHSQLTEAQSLKEIEQHADEGLVSVVPWCGEDACYDKFAAQADGLEGFGTSYEEHEEKPCVACGVSSTTRLFVARTY